MFIQSSLGSSFETCTIIYNIHSITQEKYNYIVKYTNKCSDKSTLDIPF